MSLSRRAILPGFLCRHHSVHVRRPHRVARPGGGEQGTRARHLAASRSAPDPDVPTPGESFPGFVSTGFLAIAVPTATPRPIQETLNTLVNEAIFSPGIDKRLTEEFSLTPRRLDLAQCAEEDRIERAKWAEPNGRSM